MFLMYSFQDILHILRNCRAYGCGVFGQDAKEVASIFKEYLNTTHKCFEKVIFAIPNGKDKNFEAFEMILAIRP